MDAELRASSPVAAQLALTAHPLTPHQSNPAVADGGMGSAGVAGMVHLEGSQFGARVVGMLDHALALLAPSLGVMGTRRNSLSALPDSRWRGNSKSWIQDPGSWIQGDLEPRFFIGAGL